MWICTHTNLMNYPQKATNKTEKELKCSSFSLKKIEKQKPRKKFFLHMMASTKKILCEFMWVWNQARNRIKRNISNSRSHLSKTKKKSFLLFFFLFLRLVAADAVIVGYENFFLLPFPLSNSNILVKYRHKVNSFNKFFLLSTSSHKRKWERKRDKCKRHTRDTDCFDALFRSRCDLMFRFDWIYLGFTENLTSFFLLFHWITLMSMRQLHIHKLEVDLSSTTCSSRRPKVYTAMCYSGKEFLRKCALVHLWSTLHDNTKV
jgi:hypothetical protein